MRNCTTLVMGALGMPIVLTLFACVPALACSWKARNS